MEVHHHSKNHGKKNWKSYAGEFLMLFLAVFCGFIAENLRESYVEKERAHEYMASMVTDLQKDTLQLTQFIRINKKMVVGIDSLLVSLKSKEPGAAKNIYMHSRFVGISALFENENGTITQLKNAGGLRLIKDTACVNAITDYEQFNTHVTKQGDAYYKSMLEILNLMEQVLDFSGAAQQTPPAGLYVSDDADKMRTFYNKCFIQRKIIENYMANLAEQKQKAVKGIELLRKKYHLS